MMIGSSRNMLLSILLIALTSFIQISTAQTDTTPPTIQYTTTTYTSEYAFINVTARVTDNIAVSNVLCLDLNENEIPGTNHTMTHIEGTSQDGTYLYQMPKGVNPPIAIFAFYAIDTSGNWVSSGVNGYILRISEREELTFHQVSLEEPVGGVLVPVDKLALSAPYIGLATTIVVAIAATAIYVKRVKRREKK